MSDLTPTPRPDLDALLSEMSEAAATWRGPGTEMLLHRAADALVAQRERADALALIIEQAPHRLSCARAWVHAEVFAPCSCWKSTATRTEATS